jgi:ABC-2 type transport system permease protein
MRNVWLIFRREFVQRGKTPGYILVTLLMAGLLLGSSLAPAMMRGTNQQKDLRVLMLDPTNRIADLLESTLQAQSTGGSIRLERVTDDERLLIERTKEPDLAVLIIEGTYPHMLKARYLAATPGMMQASAAILKPLEGLVRAARLQDRQIDPAVAAEVLQPLEVDVRQVVAGEQRDSSAFNSSILGVVSAVMMIYMVVLMNGSFVFMGVLEEKVSRVVEVMSASVRPEEMLAGKVAGLGALGMIQFLCLAAAQVGGSLWAGRISGTPSPSLSLGVGLLAAVFLTLGFALMATMMAAAAATVSRMEDANTMMMPFTLIMVLPMMFLAPIISEPNGKVATILSLIPVWTPQLMLLRVAVVDVPRWQVILSLVMLVVTTIVMVRIGARVYRTALLSFGARPSMKQLWGYLRSG